MTAPSLQPIVLHLEDVVFFPVPIIPRHLMRKKIPSKYAEIVFKTEGVAQDFFKYVKEHDMFGSKYVVSGVESREAYKDIPYYSDCYVIAISRRSGNSLSIRRVLRILAGNITE